MRSFSEYDDPATVRITTWMSVVDIDFRCRSYQDVGIVNALTCELVMKRSH